MFSLSLLTAPLEIETKESCGTRKEILVLDKFERCS